MSTVLPVPLSFLLADATSKVPRPPFRATHKGEAIQVLKINRGSVIYRSQADPSGEHYQAWTREILVAPEGTPMQRCKECGEEKALAEFSLSNLNGGPLKTCKACIALKSNAWRAMVEERPRESAAPAARAGVVDEVPHPLPAAIKPAPVPPPAATTQRCKVCGKEQPVDLFQRHWRTGAPYTTCLDCISRKQIAIRAAQTGTTSPQRADIVEDKPRAQIPVALRNCRECGQEKPDAEFIFMPSGNLSRVCRSCVRAKQSASAQKRWGEGVLQGPLHQTLHRIKLLRARREATMQKLARQQEEIAEIDGELVKELAFIRDVKDRLERELA